VGFALRAPAVKLPSRAPTMIQKLTLASRMENLISTPAAGRGTRSSIRTTLSYGAPPVRESC